PRVFSTHPPTTEIYTLSLHDALPIYLGAMLGGQLPGAAQRGAAEGGGHIASRSRKSPSVRRNSDASVAVFGSVRLISASTTLKPDRKSTRLNSSHVKISYAVFCLKKK